MHVVILRYTIELNWIEISKAVVTFADNCVFVFDLITNGEKSTDKYVSGS